MNEAIVYLAGVEWDAIKGTDRHLVEHLAKRTPVFWVDPPLSLAQAIRRGERRRLLRPVEVTAVGDDITRASVLVTPFPQRLIVVAATAVQMRVGVRMALRSRGIKVQAVVSSSAFTPLRLAPKPAAGGRRIYYATDDFVAGAGLLGHSPRRTERAERCRLREADAAAAISPQILQRWSQIDGAALLPNGCDSAAFAGVDDALLPADVALTAPVAGVVGQLSSRIDLGLLEAVADEGMSLLLVGPLTDDIDRPRFNCLAQRENVRWVGPKPFVMLPSYLRLIDVGLTPYTDTAFNRSSFPLKTLEYLAAGRPVVSTRLPAVEVFPGDLVDIADDPAAFAAQAVDAVRRDSPAARQRRQRFAARHDWSVRAAVLHELACPSETSHIR